MAGSMLRLANAVACMATVGWLCGCNKAVPPAESGDIKVAPGKGSSTTVPATPFAHLHKPFKEAIVPDTDLPGDVSRPPDVTVTGKKTAKLFEQIAGVDGKGGVWDEIRFVSPTGKRIHYRATIRTDLGNIELEFFPDDAPNHVRSFLALAKVGYYDGLAFDQILNTRVGDAPWTCLLAGCPLGTGEERRDSIGYWLLPEINKKHDVGTIGIWHGESVASAACRFYINLTKATWLDGDYTVFGKISQGLDVARKISERPVHEEDNRPQQPVIIREVIIQQVVDEAQVVARTP